jgi:hypothetical protein
MSMRVLDEGARSVGAAAFDQGCHVVGDRQPGIQGRMVDLEVKLQA